MFNENSEKINGRLAMASLPIMAIVYLTTGQIIPGIF